MQCQISAKIPPKNIALYPLYFDVTLTTLLVQAANKRNKKLVFLMQQIYIFIFCIWPALIVIGIFSEGMLYDPRQDSHLYSNVICKGWNNCNETVSIWYFATFEVNELIGKTCVVLRRQPKFLWWYTCWLNFEIYQLLFPVFPAQTQCGTSFTQCGGRGGGRGRGGGGQVVEAWINFGSVSWVKF